MREGSRRYCGRAAKSVATVWRIASVEDTELCRYGLLDK